MNPPSILLDRSFLAAVADADDSKHHEAIAAYRLLLDDFVEQRCLLVARADHLAAVGDPDLSAPVDTLHIARQHVYAAAKLRGDQLDPDLAITLVLIRRQRIHAVASFDERLERYEVPNFVALNVLDTSVATKFVAD